MALDPKEKDRMDKLDFSKGGGFSDFITGRQKMMPADSKFLFIGLGGKGSSTVASLKTGVYQKIQCDENKKRPNNFEYLVIDTDEGNLSSLEKGSFGEVSLSNENAEICQLYDNIAAGRLNPSNRKLIPDNITEWLNPMMNKELTGDGAGGIRQAGRYLLFGEQAFGQVLNSLTSKLKGLHGQITNPAKQKLIVYIFAGVGGGTGSGTIIDIPYIIREICERNNWKVSLYSYIFLPDTYKEDARAQEHVKYNSYAALKEIDTLMNIGQMNGAARFKAEYTVSFKVNSTERIFDSCVLVSGKKQTGMVLNPDKFSRNVVVDNIISLVTKSVTTSTGEFLANSFLDNHLTVTQNNVSLLPDASAPKNAYYQYTVIGTGSLVLPIEEVLAYIAYHVTDMLETAWNKHAQQSDANTLLDELKLQPDAVADIILEKSSVLLMKDAAETGLNVNKNQVLDNTFSNMLKQFWMGKNTALYDAWDRAKNNYIASVIEKIEERCNEMFQHEEKGIYFLNELLSFSVVDGQRFNGLRMLLSRDFKTALAGLMNGQQEIQNQIRYKKSSIQSDLNSSILFTGRLVEEYKKLSVAELVCENMMYLYDEIVRDCLDQVIQYLEVKIEELQTYIEVFDYMKEIIDRNYELAMNGTMPKAEYAIRLIDFNTKDDLPTQRVIRYLDDMLEKAKPEGLAVKLESDILKTKEKWMHGEKGFNEKFDPMSVFVSFLEQKFGEIPNLTIEKFIRLKYGDAGFGNGMQDICSQLMNKAEVIFPAKNNIALSSLASRRYIVLPAGAPDIANSMTVFANQQADKPSIAQSEDMNSIYWYNLVIGVPMFLLKDIQDYENSYEANIISGMHCQESGSENWKEWPNLENQALWPIPDANIREKKYALKVQKDTEAYLACGLIHQTENGNKEVQYSAWCMPEGNAGITRETVVDWCKNTYLNDPLQAPDGSIESGSDFTKIMAESNMFSEYLLNIPSVYMNITEESLYKMLRMNIFLYHKLQKVYEVYTECRALIDEMNQGRRESEAIKESMERFYDYFRTGIIQATEEYVLLEHKSGRQDEIIDFENYNVLQNEFFLYYAVFQFMGMYDEEQLQEIDEYKAELLADKSARNKYKQLSDEFIAECERERKMLLKLSTQKSLKKAGEQKLVENGEEFFDQLISMRKGKAKG